MKHIMVAKSASYNCIPEIRTILRCCDVIFTSSLEMARQIDTHEFHQSKVVVCMGRHPDSMTDDEIADIAKVMMGENVVIHRWWTFSDVVDISQKYTDEEIKEFTSNIVN